MGYVLSMDEHKLAGCVHGGEGTGYLGMNNTRKKKKISDTANERMIGAESCAFPQKTNECGNTAVLRAHARISVVLLYNTMTIPNMIE